MNALKAITAAGVIIVAMLAAACSPGGGYAATEPVDPDGWAYINAVTFTPQRADSLAPVNLKLAVRNDVTFPYSNLWLKIDYNDRGTQRSDTLNLQLADLYGRWLGRGFGATYQREVTVAEGVVPANGEPIVVRHIMRVDTLRGITRLGISLEPQ